MSIRSPSKTPLGATSSLVGEHSGEMFPVAGRQPCSHLRRAFLYIHLWHLEASGARGGCRLAGMLPDSSSATSLCLGPYHADASTTDLQGSG